jgi:hypothetical protein
VSRVPVYLFLFWVARALYTLDSLSWFLSIFLSRAYRQAAAGQEKEEDADEEEEKDAGRRIRKELSSIVVVFLD